MVNLIQSIQILSAVILAATLFALLDGLVKEQPAAITVALSLLAQLGALVSSSPLMKKTPLEADVIKHLKGMNAAEPKHNFDAFLRTTIQNQNVVDIYKSLLSRGIVSHKTVSKSGAVFDEVRLTLRARLA